MTYKDDEPLQGTEMRDRVFAKLSSTSGHLENQKLDLDARNLALLGKRQRLKVALTYAVHSLAALIISSGTANLRESLLGCLFHNPARVLGINSMVRQYLQYQHYELTN